MLLINLSYTYVTPGTFISSIAPQKISALGASLALTMVCWKNSVGCCLGFRLRQSELKVDLDLGKMRLTSKVFM